MLTGERMHKLTKTWPGHLLMLGLLAGGLVPRSAFAFGASLERYLKAFSYYPVSFKATDDVPFMIEVQIDGKKKILLVDTGCPVTTLDTRKVPNLKTIGQLKTQLEDSVLGPLSDPSILLMDKLEIGGAQFVNQPARAAKLDADYIRLPFDGLIGLDFLLRNFCFIDCGNQQIFFRGSRPTPDQMATMAETLRGSGFAEVPIRCTSRLILAAGMGGQTLGWMVDTGASYSVIEESARARLKLKLVKKERPDIGSYLPSDVEGWNIGLQGLGLGTHRLRVVRLPALRIGPQTWRDLYVGVADFDLSQMNDTADSAVDIHGLLGAELLASHGALIDFSSMTIWLRPNRSSEGKIIPDDVDSQTYADQQPGAGLDRTPKLDPLYADIYADKGNEEQDNGDYDGAIADYDKAIKLNGSFVKAYVNRGMAKAGKRDYRNAILDFDRAIQLKPTLADAYCFRGLVKLNLRDFSGAFADYDRATRLNPVLPQTYDYRGFARRITRDYNGAIVDFNQAIRLWPGFSAAYADRGETLCLMGDYARALPDFNKSITLALHASEYIRFHRYLTLVRLGRGKDDDLAKQLRGWADGWPRNIGLFLTGGITEEALDLKAAAGSPGDIKDRTCEADYYIGMVNLLNGQKERATRRFKACLDTGVSDYQESIFAEAELARLNAAGAGPK